MRIAKSLMSKICQRFKNTSSLKKKRQAHCEEASVPPRSDSPDYDLVNLPGPGAAGLWHIQCPTVPSLGTPDLEDWEGK